MQSSTEIRWFFYERKDIIEIEKWFAGFNLKLSDGKFDRQDYYLKLAGVTSLGLKIREANKNDERKWVGKLEAKVLVRELDLPSIANGNSGNANQWTKFSFSLPAGESTLTEILSDLALGDNVVDLNHWIRMDKDRILLMYDLEKKELTKSNEKINEGCGIELTALQLEGVVYYSFGLEAFSGSARHQQNLFETLKYVLNELKITGLSKQNSLTYPEFLTTKI
ncbi:MAG: hypothetical protein ABIN67_10180 [Ferruginibacter sp.]